MKRLAELTAEDLRTSPVWRFEGGTGAEALVARADRATLSKLDDEIFLAATDFELFDSTLRFGFCFPAEDSGLDYLQPVIIAGDTHVGFWFDGPVSAATLEKQWKALGKEPREIFPVQFRCLVPVDGRTVNGRIERVESTEDVAREAPAPSARIEDAPKREGTSRRSVEGRRPGIGTGEKRTARRRKAEMTVEFTQDALHGVGVVGDVSRRGMFVRSDRIPGTGPMLRLKVNLPDGRQLVLKGRVVRSEGEQPSSAPGFGLRLLDDWPDYERLFPPKRPK
jgi:hypothetical protein